MFLSFFLSFILSFFLSFFYPLCPFVHFVTFTILVCPYMDIMDIRTFKHGTNDKMDKWT